MQFGVLLPHVGFSASPSAIRDVAQAAEELGFASLWVGDHIVLPDKYESLYPFNDEGAFPVPSERPFTEAFTTLAYTAAITSSVRLGVSVCIVPYRHPLLLAKTASTLDFLAGGRLILGVGVGWLRQEFEALNALPFEQRGAVTDEALTLLQQAWAATGPINFAGRFFQVEGMYVSPPPPQGQDLTIWVGGMGTAAWRRTARFGHAWHPALYGADPDHLRQGLAAIRSSAEAAGRTAPAGGWSISLWLPAEFADADPDPATDGWPWQTGVLRGTPDYMVNILRRFAAAGVDHVILVMGGSAASKIKNMQRFTAEVLPHVRD